MVAPLPEVADLVLLELVAVDDDRLRSLLVALLLFLVAGLGIGVQDDERQPRAVRRPGVVLDSPLQVGDPLRFAAGPVQEPDLVGVGGIVAARQGGQGLGVRAEAPGGLSGPAGG